MTKQPGLNEAESTRQGLVTTVIKGLGLLPESLQSIDPRVNPAPKRTCNFKHEQLGSKRPAHIAIDFGSQFIKIASEQSVRGHKKSMLLKNALLLSRARSSRSLVSRRATVGARVQRRRCTPASSP